MPRGGPPIAPGGGQAGAIIALDIIGGGAIIAPDIIGGPPIAPGAGGAKPSPPNIELGIGIP